MHSSKIGSFIVGAVMAYGVAGVSTPAVSLARPMQVTIPETSDTLNGLPETDTTAALQIAYRADQQNLDPSVDAEINRRFNELRQELLDDRASTIDWWLIGITVFLGLVTILVALVGIAGYLEFRRVREQALEAVGQAQESAEEAKRFVEEIKQIRDKAQEYFQDMDAKKVDDDPGAERQAEVVSNDPEASLMDRAVARAISLQKEGEIEEAIKTWRGIADAITGIDNDLAARALFSVGYLESEREGKTNLEEVFLAYDEAIRLNPGFTNAYNNRGLAKAEQGRYEDAITDYDEAIRLKPDDADIYSNRGLAKAEQGRYEDAIADYDKAIRLNPGLAGAYSNRGNAKAKQGRYEDAIADHDKAIRLNPGLAGAYSNRGNAKAKLGRYKDAITDFNEAIRLKSDDADAYSNRGLAKAEQGQYEDAIGDYDKAIRLNPDDADAYNKRGIAKAELGHIAEARADFKKARELAKNAGDEKTISMAEENLRKLENSEDT